MCRVRTIPLQVYERIWSSKGYLFISSKRICESLDSRLPLPTVKMGRFYIRFFEHGIETDWYRFDHETMDYLVECVLEMCGPVYHSRAYFDTYEDGDELCLSYSLQDRPTPIPKDVLAKTIEFGWGKTRKELRLVGDRIPIDEIHKFQITYS